MLILLGCSAKPRYDSHGLHSIEIRMRPEDLGAVNAGAVDGVTYPARALIDGDEHRIKISVAGVTTVNAPKKSYNLELLDGRYRGAKKIRISANIKDPTMIRPFVALEIFAAAGVPNSWIEPAFVHVNDRVLGVYAIIERVDDDFFGNRAIAWDRIYEALGDADFGATFESRLDIAFEGEPKPQDLGAMLALRRTVTIAETDAFLAAVFRILDRDALVNYMAAAQIAAHFDGFNKNLFYFRVASTRLIHFAPWDFDLTWRPDMGGANDAWDANVLFTRLGRTPAFRAAIDAKVSALIAGSLSKSALLDRIAFWKSELATGYAHDPTLGATGRSIEDEANRLATAVADRIDLLP